MSGNRFIAIILLGSFGKFSLNIIGDWLKKILQSQLPV